MAPHPAPESEPPGASEEPPLSRPAVPPALIGGLSYSALSEYKRCGYRFYVQRVLGVSEPEELAAGDGDEQGEEAPDSPDPRRRFGPGVAVHSLLEWSARSSWREPDAERIAAALREQGLAGDGGEVAHAKEMVAAWLASPLREELGAGRAGAEVPFVLSLGRTLVRGEIDLLVARPDGSVTVVDYKTDRLEGREPSELVGRYAVQRDLYALAAASRGAPVETAYVFLERPDAPIRESFDAEALGAARGRVEELLAKLASGDFAVTDRPHRALCHDCPARERLCSYGAELTMRDSDEPVEQ